MKRTLSIDPTNGVFLFWVSALLYILFPILLIERMVLDRDTLTNIIFPSYRLLSIIACIVCLVAISYVKKLRINLYSIMIGIFLMIAFVKGFLNITNASYLFTHISAGLTMLLFYLAGTSCYIQTEKMISHTRLLAYLFLAEYAVLTLVGYLAYQYSGLLILDNFHLSLNIAPLLISFLYFLVEGQLGLNIFVLFLLFLSGKRSLLVTAAIMYGLWFCIIDKQTRLTFVKRFRSVLIIFSVAITMLSTFSNKLSFMDSATRRLSTLNPFSGNASDLDNISSGRLNEFLVVYHTMTDSISNFLFGSGFGNYIGITYQSTLDHQFYFLEKIGFDILPVHFLYHLGFPATLFLLVGISVIIINAYRRVRRSYRREFSPFAKTNLVWFLFMVSIVINSCFTYINPDPVLWFGLGLLSSGKMKSCSSNRQQIAIGQQTLLNSVDG